jgi:hypothetical protein
MSLQSLYELRNQPVLRYATTAAVINASEDILNEDPQTANHANRLLWANRPPEVNAAQIMVAVARNTDVQTKWAARAAQEEWTRFDDPDIQYIVNSNVDRFATG